MGKAESASCHATSWLLSITSFGSIQMEAGIGGLDLRTGAEEEVHQPRPGGAEVEAG